jgi:hypothetical protein
MVVLSASAMQPISTPWRGRGRSSVPEHRVVVRLVAVGARDYGGHVHFPHQQSQLRLQL